MRRTASFAMCCSERGVVQGRGITWIRRPRTGYYAAAHNVVDARSAVGMASTVILAVVGQGFSGSSGSWKAQAAGGDNVALYLRGS